MNSVLQIRCFAYGKFNVMLILDEIFIINTVYFHFTSFKLVKQYFVELLYRMTKILFSNASNKNIAKRYLLVNLLLMKCILIFVCVYFLYCYT